MAQARQRDQWNHTATLLAMLANGHRDPNKSRILRPADFHPMPEANIHRQPPPKGDIAMLKSIFIDQRPGGH